jgi:hypothetical protein
VRVLPDVLLETNFQPGFVRHGINFQEQIRFARPKWVLHRYLTGPGPAHVGLPVCDFAPNPERKRSRAAHA